jgi:SAM-dependent methyltransferase
MNSQKIKKFYQDRYKKHGVTPQSLLWKQRGAAHQRFRQMWAEIDFNNKSVLDVGCGFGEMAGFLKKRYKGVSYTGVDIVPEFISQAKNFHPDCEFVERDYFNDPMKEKFDMVMASGTINSNVKNNMKFRKKAVKIMFEHTKKVLVFNMLGTHPQPANSPESNVWYADSLQILKYCMSLTRRVVFRANYHPTDFTIFMYLAHGTKKGK